MLISGRLAISANSKQMWLSAISRGFSSDVGSGATKRICIVGSGPAGFYAAQYILKHLNGSVVDVIEKLPVPFGLVRYGVAPDHPEVKNVINTFTKTAEHKNFNFWGNVALGKDVSLQNLRERYHAVLLTYGADQDRQLNIPNEDQPNVLSARKFVEWYNGLPGAQHLNPILGGQTVTILGQGNVAVDVARMLLSPLDVLRVDTTEYALETLSRSKVEQVYLVGRRGPLQAAFTIKELREMLKLPNVQTLWRPDDFTDVPAQIPNLQRPRKRLTELMLKSLSEQSASTSNKKQFLPIFLRAPKFIKDNKIELTVTKLQNDIAVPTNRSEHLQADLLLRSIGYKSTCVDGGICFDKRSGCVYNEYGRVLKDAASKTVDKGLYVAGWLGTGPTGVILTTMNGAFSVAKTICDDILSNEVDTSKAKLGLEAKQFKRLVTWSHWERIDQAEMQAGQKLCKPREKFVDVEEMLKVAGL
ncbi:PREDICTED: NADPH:adrenodoxin oxidoreductase, mitochondrial isoform X2 [Rhagoletis zephyria]|uniref:NADPH:adrenodoxin oxidoreductase, mitochondrial isoform X2 n=1 Tax=Rhagoletis zephyria TaxID=28612 RepID=UPI0008117116|nr:PREDICTED: NADPH:adrenodoxin oxidoreductase, mitochondrial isoform X2 [Rhagoletis zephyria]